MSRQFCEDPGLMFELAIRVLQDAPPPEMVDAVCLFGQTAENEKPMLDKVAETYHRGKADWVAVSGYEGMIQGELVVHGCRQWLNELVKRGVPSVKIVCYKLSTALPPSTDAEALGLIAMAKDLDLFSLSVTVPPLHQFRVFVSVVSAARKLGMEELRIYSHPAKPASWSEAVIHSQSAPRAPRAHQIAGELAKMDRYCAKGDHLPASEILAYLNWRDGLV